MTSMLTIHWILSFLQGDRLQIYPICTYRWTYPWTSGRPPPRFSCRKPKGELADFSITPEQWGKFLCTLFDEWVKEDVGKYYIQIFDSTLANWVGEQPGICTMAKTCGHAGVMEFNGDVYSCDHFVFPEYKLGNIYSQTLVEMMHSERQHKFGNMKYQSLPTQCKECDFLLPATENVPRTVSARQPTANPGWITYVKDTISSSNM